MKRQNILCSFAICLTVVALAISGTASAASKAEKRQDVRDSAKATLSRLYEAKPSAKKAVESAAGYAVFSNFGMKLFLAGGGAGQGLAVENANKKTTYMKMAELQAGLGFGIQKFRIVLVFETTGALRKFVDSGWQFGGKATIGANNGDAGKTFAGAASVSPGVWMYQLTDSGLAAEITLSGTKFYKDKSLN